MRCITGTISIDQLAQSFLDRSQTVGLPWFNRVATQVLTGSHRVVDQGLFWIESVVAAERSAVQSVFGKSTAIEFYQVHIWQHTRVLLINCYHLIQPLNIGFIPRSLVLIICVLTEPPGKRDR